MFHLIDRVQGGIEPMLKYLEEHIISTGLADMIAAASVITQVRLTTLACIFISVSSRMIMGFVFPFVGL